MSHEKIGIIRTIDKGGRLCIPSELRDLYSLGNGDEVEFLPTEDGILVRKAEKTCLFCHSTKDLLPPVKNIRICRACFNSLALLNDATKGN